MSNNEYAIVLGGARDTIASHERNIATMTRLTEDKDTANTLLKAQLNVSLKLHHLTIDQIRRFAAILPAVMPSSNHAILINDIVAHADLALSEWDAFITAEKKPRKRTTTEEPAERKREAAPKRKKTRPVEETTTPPKSILDVVDECANRMVHTNCNQDTLNRYTKQVVRVVTGTKPGFPAFDMEPTPTNLKDYLSDMLTKTDALADLGDNSQTRCGIQKFLKYL